MDYWPYLTHPFSLGLMLGLAVAAIAWKSGFSTRRRIGRDIKKLENELRELQGHLNTQLKINAQGNETLQRELEELRRQNENLRVSLATLQSKPGRAELRQAQITEGAVRLMREQAPGFAPAWEKALRHSEAELEAGESGLKKLVRRVIPSIGNSSSASSAPITIQDTDVA
jgi:chromosome segregation ATPase